MSTLPDIRTSAGRTEGQSAVRREAVRLRHEAPLLGVAAFAAPPLVLVSFAFVGLIAAAPGRLLTVALEAGVPLATGLAAAAILANESALELQLASPRGFRPAALRRLVILVAWATVASIVATALGRLTGIMTEWPGPASPLDDVLLSVAPLAAFASAGCVLGIALRSRGAAAAALSGFWLAGLAFKDWFLASDPMRAWYPFLLTFAPKAADSLANRLTLLAIAAAALAVAAAWLGRGEWLLGSEDR